MVSNTRVRDRFLTPATVADEYGISERTLRRRISDGTIPGYRVGRQIRIKESDLNKLARRIPAAAVR